LVEATDKIREAYTGEHQLLQPGQEVINVTVIKARSVQALVLREDSIMNWPIFKANSSTLAVKRGSGKAIDLPIYQNDVLHALTETGGLPGSDAGHEVWILRGAQKENWEAVTSVLDREGDPTKVLSQDTSTRVVRIPLKVLPGEPLIFTPA